MPKETFKPSEDPSQSEKDEQKQDQKISRRKFLKRTGIGIAGLSAAAMAGGGIELLRRQKQGAEAERERQSQEAEKQAEYVMNGIREYAKTLLNEGTIFYVYCDYGKFTPGKFIDLQNDEMVVYKLNTLVSLVEQKLKESKCVIVESYHDTCSYEIHLVLNAAEISVPISGIGTIATIDLNTGSVQINKPYKDIISKVEYEKSQKELIAKQEKEAQEQIDQAMQSLSEILPKNIDKEHPPVIAIERESSGNPALADLLIKKLEEAGFRAGASTNELNYTITVDQEKLTIIEHAKRGSIPLIKKQK